jgi:hypothetical protein
LSEVSTTHPAYADRIEEWQVCRDAARGETAVKGNGGTYLPMPSGFKTQKDGGAAIYAAYQTRAQFPEIMNPTISGMVGVIHRNEFGIEMPEAMEPIWERATKDGLPLESFHRRITAELLTTGRYAILADAPAEGGDIPYLSGYTAETLINWSDDRDFYVLDESGPVRNGFRWEDKVRHLVLELVDGKYKATRYEDGVAVDAGIEPQARGGKALDEIPLVVIGARDLSMEPDDPPLIGVARSSIALYQLSADYRWQLFMTGQETLFVINADAPEIVGAGVNVSLKGDSETKAPDAKYVGPAGTGINAHRVAMQDERQAAVSAGAKLFEGEGSSQESGEARRLRFAAQTATLQTIANASAAGLEKALRYVAVMMNLDPEQVIVTPPRKLVDSALTPQEAEYLVKIWQAGAMSFETLYENLQRGEIASPERTAEDELKLIDEEDSSREEEAAALLPPNVPPVDPTGVPPEPEPIAA